MVLPMRTKRKLRGKKLTKVSNQEIQPRREECQRVSLRNSTSKVFDPDRIEYLN